MPIYEYSCEDCQHVFEEWQKDFTDKEITCPICGGRSKRMISNTAFILKGSGWYVTDYARGAAASSSGNGGNGNGDSAKSSETSAGSSAAETSSGSASSSEGTKTTSSQDT
ncbi:MAG: zinc ribbon domain-containing protein [Desulfovermiculus sp.]|nr:zinc ribbon domain-containing protein [Desulfovermiculus sp.]